MTTTLPKKTSAKSSKLTIKHRLVYKNDKTMKAANNKIEKLNESPTKSNGSTETEQTLDLDN